MRTRTRPLNVLVLLVQILRSSEQRPCYGSRVVLVQRVRAPTTVEGGLPESVSDLKSTSTPAFSLGLFGRWLSKLIAASASHRVSTQCGLARPTLRGNGTQSEPETQVSRTPDSKCPQRDVNNALAFCAVHTKTSRVVRGRRALSVDTKPVPRRHVLSAELATQRRVQHRQMASW